MLSFLKHAVNLLLRRRSVETVSASTLNPRGHYTLVIVDMQPDFPASRSLATLYAVERQILQAISLGCPIVVLEYDGDGETNEVLMRHLTGRYSRFAVRKKSRDDGSAEALEACHDHGYPVNRFRVCGVNTDACVKSTVDGLSSRLGTSRIEIIKEACNCPWPFSWKQLARNRNVVLVQEAPEAVPQPAA